MTEGVFPKKDGDILYASEVNQFLLFEDFFSGEDGDYTQGNITGEKYFNSINLVNKTIEIQNYAPLFVKNNVNISGCNINGGLYRAKLPSNGSDGRDAVAVQIHGLSLLEGGVGGRSRYPLIIVCKKNISISNSTINLMGENGENGSSVSPYLGAQDLTGGAGGGLFTRGGNVDNRVTGGLDRPFSGYLAKNLLFLPAILPGNGGRGGKTGVYYSTSQGGDRVSGAGGGGAGSYIYLYAFGSITISNTTINCNGGNGGTSGSPGANGSGGAIILLYGNQLNLSGNTFSYSGASDGIYYAKQIKIPIGWGYE